MRARPAACAISWRRWATSPRPSHAASFQAPLDERYRRLDETNLRLQATLAMSGTAAGWDWHIADRRLFGDARFAALHGLDPEAMAQGVGTAAFFAAIHPEDQARIRLAVGGMLRGAEVFSKEYRLLLADGPVRWVQARGRCELDEQERPARFVGALVDITEQKRVEEQLRIAQTAGGVGAFEYVDGFATVSVSPQFCRPAGAATGPRPAAGHGERAGAAAASADHRPRRPAPARPGARRWSASSPGRTPGRCAG